MNPLLPKHGGQIEAIARHFGLDACDLLDFSASINPDGPPQSVVRSLRAALEESASFTLYPDLEEFELKGALAVYTGVAQEKILVANGFAPLLDAVIRTLKVRECLLPVPCFNEYRRILEQNEVRVNPLLLRPEDDFRYDIDALLEGSQDALLLANPQNPSGVLFEKSALLKFVERAAARGTYVLLDEAFIDYARDSSLTEHVESFDNLVVFRSVTKCFGVPGLRVAYALAPRAMRARVDAHLAAWPISTFASVGIIAALEDTKFSAALALVNQTRREKLVRGLEALHLRVLPAAANFLLFRVPPGIDAEWFWRQMITQHHIVLRLCHNIEGMPLGYLRTAVRNDADGEALVDAISSLLGTS